MRSVIRSTCPETSSILTTSLTMYCCSSRIMKPLKKSLTRLCAPKATANPMTASQLISLPVSTMPASLSSITMPPEKTMTPAALWTTPIKRAGAILAILGRAAARAAGQERDQPGFDPAENPENAGQ